MEDQQQLFHYTTLDVFQCLIDGFDGENLTFWASSIFSLNDSQEFLHGYEVIQKQIEAYEVRKHLTQELCLGPIMDHHRNEILDRLFDNEQMPYIVSFSHESDSLPLWNMYGANGHGINLGFWYYKLDISEDVRQGFVVPNVDAVFCLCDKLPAKDVLYEGLPIPQDAFEKIYRKSIEGTSNLTGNDLRNEQIKAIATLLFCFAPMIKHKSFSFEKESRYIAYPKDLSQVKFRTNARGNVVPYIKVKVPIKNLRSITIGPCSNYQAVKPVVKAELCKYNITNIQIKLSEVPYREY